MGIACHTAQAKWLHSLIHKASFEKSVSGSFDSTQLFMFLYQGWYLSREKETSLLTLRMANFGLTATSLFEIWTPAWSSARTSGFHKGIFSFLVRMVVFLSSLGLFFSLFYQGLSSAFDFFMSKDFSIIKQRTSVCEFCTLWDVN